MPRMGRQSRIRQMVKEAREDRAAKPTATIIHRTSFESRHGMTPQEYYSQVVWTGAKCYCYICGSRKIVAELKYFMSPTDLVAREPAIAAKVFATNDGQLPVWKSKYGPMVKFAVEYTCRLHAKQVEIDAAKLPSHILVDIDRGPEPNKKTVVAVPARPHDRVRTWASSPRRP